MSDEIPTAEKYFSNENMGLSEDNYDWVAKDSVVKYVKKFTQFHVEAALKAAYDEATAEYDSEWNSCSINKDSILGAYPKENIK